MNTLGVLLTLVIVFAFVSRSTQYVASPLCFGQKCPSSTTNCKEHRKSSPDRSRIQVKITCLDDFDASVKDYYFEEPSHLDSYTFYENTRFESINEGVSRNADPYKSLELTPYHRQPEYY